MEREFIRQKIRTMVHGHAESINHFVSIFKKVNLRKNQILNCRDSKYRSIYYNHDGVLALHQTLHHHKNPRELTIQIYRPESFFSLPYVDYPRLQLSALTNCLLLQADYQDLRRLLSKDLNILNIMESLEQTWQQQNLDQFALITIRNATERYLALQEKLGSDIYHVPQQQLASYLGISRKHLGRLNYKLLKLKY